MGKASKWFRGLLGLKKPDHAPSQPSAKPPSSKPPKRRWSFMKPHKEKEHRTPYDGRRGPPENVQSSDDSYVDEDAGVDPNKHAIAVAAATAAVAEAAVAAAQAAAAVVRLTSSGRSVPNATVYRGFGIREEWAAVKIQSYFRAYLSRRALRALKALVRLQALVRGHIIRKQTADMLRRMHALLRAQSRARAGRAQLSDSPQSSSISSQFSHPGPATPEKFEHPIRARNRTHEHSSMLKRSGSKSNGAIFMYREKALLDRRMDDEKSDKILEIDTGKPQFAPKRALASDQNSQSFTTSKDSTVYQAVPSPSSCEVQLLSPLKLTQDVEDTAFCTGDSSPQFYCASSKGGSMRGAFTPTQSDGSRSYLSGYSDYPNYMSFTESSKAKMRSLSAPRQRTHFERSSTTKRYSVHGYADLPSGTQRISSLHANFTSKAYPGSGHLDRLGMPIGGDGVGFSGGHWN
ncbi:hypothetical protein RJ639_042314 [Escallonia herrerae]|uniref:DUF4005 domain-containing protein n=1 Tax=Escallonia herrerae TaxID=1293975 RepID=A0AA88WU22_9ASTE|nr:hypothetical protein RJ639_042314 [Escallonia herrerae]